MPILRPPSHRSRVIGTVGTTRKNRSLGWQASREAGPGQSLAFEGWHSPFMRWAGASVCVLLLLILLPPLAPSVSAQALLETFESAQLSLDTLEIDPSLRSAEPPPGRVEEAPAPKPPSPEVLPTPPLQPQDGVEKLAPVFGVTVREIRVTGSTVFSPDELAQVARPFVDRKLTTEDLEELRQALTTLYTDQGYVNSGAFIPDQDVTDGILEVQLVEGILSDIQVEQVEGAKLNHVLQEEDSLQDWGIHLQFVLQLL